MKKTIIIVVSVLVVIAIVIGGIFIFNKEEKPVVSMETSQDLESIINSVNEKANLPLRSLSTTTVDISNEMTLTSYTGLKSTEGIEQVVVSEPMITSQAYSLVLVKVADNADVEAIKKEMLDNVDVRKWICVTAEKVYVTNYQDLICLVMSSEELAKPVYNAFKEVVQGKVGTELERTTEEAYEEQPGEIVAY